MTVLFADVSGFTALSERMDPEDVKIFADRCVARMSAEVERFGGTVLRVLGDEVFAVFGAPVAHEDDAERAVRAGVALRDLNLSDDPAHPVQVHTGINSGEVMTGLIGPGGVRDYTVMGDTVNTAARLRSAAPPGSVLVGETTYRATRQVVNYRQVSPVLAKGKDRPVAAWEALEVTAAPGARPLGTAPLIGRRGELEHLESLWQRVRREAQPHLVTLLGDPGIGKSRLVAEFERRLPKEVQVLHGRCLPYGEALGYWALTTALKEAAGITAEDTAEAARARLEGLVASVMAREDDAAEVARHLALLSGLDVEADRQDGTGDQRLLHATVRRFLEACARQRPLCLIFDDIHWADDALLDLLESVAARAREAPLLIMTQARPELLEKRAGWGRGVRSFTSLHLEPLSRSEERDLILALARERGLPPKVAAEISRGTGGNPLFAEELVAMIAEGGQPTEIPSLIKLLISARLDALPPGERGAIQFASVFGKVFWEGGLRALGVPAAADLPEHLEALEQKDLLRSLPRAQFGGDREYTFKHDLIRDVAYEMLPRAERRALHGRVADWLEQAAGERVEAYFDQLAHHAVQAGQHERAIGYLVRAAERASRAAAHRQAAGLLGQAITLAEGIDQRELVADLRARRAQAFMGVGMWAEARPELEAALALLPPERLEQRAQFLLDLAATRFWGGLDTAEVRPYSSEALRLAEATGREDLAAAALTNLAAIESADGNLQASLDLFEHALARAGGAPIVHAAELDLQGLISYWRGRYREAIPHTHAAIERSRGDTAATVFAMPHLGLALAADGRYAEAAQVFAEAQRLGREYEVWPFLARAVAMSAGFHLDLFDFAEHESIAEAAREQARSVNFLPSLVSANIDLLLNLARRQEVGRAETLIEEVAATVEKAGGWHGWLWRLRLAEARAELALARGDWEEAQRWAENAVAQSQARGRVKYHVLGLETRAQALHALGRTREALADLRTAVELARPTGDPAMFLRAATGLLSLEGDDTLAGEAHAAVQRIAAALPDEAMRRRFESAEPVRLVARLTR